MPTLKFRRTFYSIVCVFICLPILASATTQTEKLWSAYTLTGNYGQMVYYVEPQLRLVYQDTGFQQFLTNIGVGYKFMPHWQIWLGQTFSADSQDAVPGSLDEYRLWQQLVWDKRFAWLRVIVRTRLEERKSLFFASWSQRLRQRVLLQKPLTDSISIVLSNELFLNLNKVNWIITERLDQNRAYIGLEQRVFTNNFLSIGYMNQYLSTPVPQSDPVLVLNWHIDLETTN